MGGLAPIELGGRTGRQFELATLQPKTPLFFGPAGDFKLDPGFKTRYRVLDFPGGGVLVVGIHTRDGGFDDGVALSEPVVATLTIQSRDSGQCAMDCIGSRRCESTPFRQETVACRCRRTPSATSRPDHRTAANGVEHFRRRAESTKFVRFAHSRSRQTSPSPRRPSLRRGRGRGPSCPSNTGASDHVHCRSH